MTLPNILTIGRLLLLPAIIGLLFQGEAWTAWSALALYVLGGITDFLDGWMARTYNLVSAFGTFLDPIADKIFVISILVTLIAVDHIQILGTIFVVIILIREFLVSGLREYLGPKNVQMPVSTLAKWKTAIQMIAGGILIIAPYIWLGNLIGTTGLGLSALLTVITGWQYMKTGLDHMR